MFKKGRNHRSAWTADEDAQLIHRCAGGDFLEDIAKAFGRSSESVRTRANLLGVPCRSGRGTRHAPPPAPTPGDEEEYRLFCRSASGSIAERRDLSVTNEAEAIAASKACASPGGCEAWKVGTDPKLLGSF